MREPGMPVPSIGAERYCIPNRTLPGHGYGPKACAWCGQKKARMYVYVDPTRFPVEVEHSLVFCNVACFRAYHMM